MEHRLIVETIKFFLLNKFKFENYLNEKNFTGKNFQNFNRKNKLQFNKWFNYHIYPGNF